MHINIIASQPNCVHQQNYKTKFELKYVR